MMALISRSKTLKWTFHCREKMRFYRLSEGRVKRVIHSPKRIEEGVAPDTVAMMQPASQTSFGKLDDWNQEIWVMVQDIKGIRKVISAWRYPGKTKARSDLTKDFLRKEYGEFLSKREND